MLTVRGFWTKKNTVFQNKMLACLILFTFSEVYNCVYEFLLGLKP